MYRAVDSNGNTKRLYASVREETKKLPRDSCSVLTPSETVDSRAVRFFKKMLKAKHNKQPRVINVDKNAAYPTAIEELKSEKLLEEKSELRQVKYLNNLVNKTREM